MLTPSISIIIFMLQPTKEILHPSIGNQEECCGHMISLLIQGWWQMIIPYIFPMPKACFGHLTQMMVLSVGDKTNLNRVVSQDLLSWAITLSLEIAKGIS